MKELLKLEIKLKLVEFEESLKQQVKNENNFSKEGGLMETTLDDYRYFVKMKLGQGKLNLNEFIAYFGKDEVKALEGDF